MCLQEREEDDQLVRGALGVTDELCRVQPQALTVLVPQLQRILGSSTRSAAIMKRCLLSCTTLLRPALALLAEAMDETPPPAVSHLWTSIRQLRLDVLQLVHSDQPRGSTLSHFSPLPQCLLLA